MFRKYWKNTKENGVWKGQSPFLKEGAGERPLRLPSIIPNPRQNTGFLGAEGGTASSLLASKPHSLRRPKKARMMPGPVPMAKQCPEVRDKLECMGHAQV